MLRRFGLLYTLFSVVVIIVLAILVVARLSTARSVNLQEAEASFRVLQRRLEATTSAEELGAALRDYRRAFPSVRALLLYDPQTGVRYAWSAESGLIAIPSGAMGDFVGLPDYRLNEITQWIGRERVDVLGTRLSIDAVYEVLAFSDAYPALRDSLISLVAFAFLTVLAALALGRSRTEGGETETRTQRPPSTEPAPPPSHSARQSHAQPEADPSKARAVAPETHAPRTVSASPAEARYEEVAIDEITTDPPEPGALFNPSTGVSFREHLERRLGLELERSAYNDQDLCCMLVRFSDASAGEHYAEQARRILATFQFEDLCFEYNDATFCVILPNTELPQGLRQAESFRRKHPCIIGISARNGRLVEASRVLKEADRSLRHAETEPGGIVGFRPDPRKYRQFVTQPRP